MKESILIIGYLFVGSGIALLCGIAVLALKFKPKSKSVQLKHNQRLILINFAAIAIAFIGLIAIVLSSLLK